MSKQKKRKIQYYLDEQSAIWCYLIKGEINPCGCGSNCFHHEYDGHTVYCVCNACDEDIYTIKDEYTKTELKKGIWK